MEDLKKAKEAICCYIDSRYMDYDKHGRDLEIESIKRFMMAIVSCIERPRKIHEKESE